ncbi:uncharacterized protein LOC143787438 [Ranitomeya variabilis]|uniref:uncharacterized protein LOC143787438 n=1 Tax=Ranitomeya variabilis TaxID=490064 RepID=UPI0040576253
MSAVALRGPVHHGRVTSHAALLHFLIPEQSSVRCATCLLRTAVEQTAEQKRQAGGSRGPPHDERTEDVQDAGAALQTGPDEWSRRRASRRRVLAGRHDGGLCWMKDEGLHQETSLALRVTLPTEGGSVGHAVSKTFISRRRPLQTKDPRKCEPRVTSCRP